MSKKLRLQGNSIIGKKIFMNNGQYAECISFRKFTDIDVRFEDGTIVKTRKNLFLNGAVKNPNFWIGKSNTMFNGQVATIIGYRGYYDIDVQFEDGTIVKNKRIGHFKSGNITNPNYNSSTKASCLYQKIRQNNGQIATCIAYRTNVDIDVKFEDGTIVYHRQKRGFLNGEIKNPNFDRFSVVGKSVFQNCGMIATCISDRNSKDIDIRFEDGTIVRHRKRDDFKRGLIKNHNLSSCLNKTVKMHNGQMATCIRYKNFNEIDVKFEDGTIVKNVSKASFISGCLNNPSFNPSSCIGYTLKMLNGQMATCINYNGSNNLDIQFEDGTIVCGKPKASFLRGEIKNPNFNPFSCINEERVMNCGMKAKCVEYRGANDIDVQFEDGTIVRNKAKSCFLKGSIANPNILNSSLPEQILYYILKKYFKDVVHNYRPNWLKNPATKTNLEIDIWIPSIKIGVEYDGAKWHGKETQKSKAKAKLIDKAEEINKVITFLERGSVVHKGKKHINYKFKSTSCSKEADEFFDELVEKINMLLNKLGIFETFKLDTKLLEDIKSSKIKKESLKSFEPETHTMNCGMTASLIAYRRSDDIDIQFEDGVVVQHTKLDSFRKGMIAHPSDRYATIKNKSSCVGKSIMQKCGKLATCIKYRKANDIDVRFEDGVVVQHKCKGHFLKGNIAYCSRKYSKNNN